MDKDKLREIEGYVEEFKTVGVDLIKNDKDDYLKVRNFKVHLNNGRVIKRGEIVKGNGMGSASVVLPITKDGRIVLVVQPRVFTEKTVAVEIPAGYVDMGEDPMDCARRELLEETGYTGGEMEFLGKYYQDQGCSRALNRYYVMFDCEKTHSQKLDGDEIIKVIEVTYEEMVWLVNNNYIMDLNSTVTWEKAKDRVKQRIRKR